MKKTGNIEHMLNNNRAKKLITTEIDVRILSEKENLTVFVCGCCCIVDLKLNQASNIHKLYL